ncbi:hypothetical protein B4146_2068 [Bacillus subtilis]|nr:hypothetical protein B4146_2068 [Bacillus subtilis]
MRTLLMKINKMLYLQKAQVMKTLVALKKTSNAISPTVINGF